MKILIISDRFPPYSGGGYEMQCKDYAHALSERGHEVHVLTTKFGLRNISIHEDAIYRSLECCATDGLSGIKQNYFRAQFKRAIFFRRNCYKIKQLVTKLQPDIVFVWQMCDISPYPLLTIQKKNIPMVYMIGDLSLIHFIIESRKQTNFFRKIVKFFLTNAWDITKLNFRNVIFISKFLQEEFYANKIFGDSHIIIPRQIAYDVNNVKDTNFKELTAFKFIFAGRVVPEKGADVAIKVIACLKKDLPFYKFTLDIYGEGSSEYRAELNKLVETIGVSDSVNFFGKVSRDYLKKIYKNYFVFLCPSVWQEPLGVVVLEAMVCGVPVIASEVGGIPEMINNGKTGFLVPPCDPEAISKIVKKIIEDNNGLYLRIHLDAIEHVRNNYSPEKIFSSVENYLFSCIGEHKK